MHLGYHELRKMLEEFSKRKLTAPSSRPPMSMLPPESPSIQRPGGERDYRSSRDDGYRERDHGGSRGGYDRGGHSIRPESVFSFVLVYDFIDSLHFGLAKVTIVTAAADLIVNDRGPHEHRFAGIDLVKYINE